MSSRSAAIVVLAIVSLPCVSSDSITPVAELAKDEPCELVRRELAKTPSLAAVSCSAIDPMNVDIRHGDSEHGHCELGGRRVAERSVREACGAPGRGRRPG